MGRSIHLPGALMRPSMGPELGVTCSSIIKLARVNADKTLKSFIQLHRATHKHSAIYLISQAARARPLN